MRSDAGSNTVNKCHKIEYQLWFRTDENLIIAPERTACSITYHLLRTSELAARSKAPSLSFCSQLFTLNSSSKLNGSLDAGNGRSAVHPEKRDAASQHVSLLDLPCFRSPGSLSSVMLSPTRLYCCPRYALSLNRRHCLLGPWLC